MTPMSRTAHRPRHGLAIALVSEHASPLAALGGEDAGGQNVHVAQLAGALADRGHAVTVYTRRDSPEPPDTVRLRDGVAVGDVRSASYGWTLGAAVGVASVAADGPVTAGWLDEGTWTVDVAGVQVPATVSLRPLYAPTSARVRA